MSVKNEKNYKVHYELHKSLEVFHNSLMQVWVIIMSGITYRQIVIDFFIFLQNNVKLDLTHTSEGLE